MDHDIHVNKPIFTLAEVLIDCRLKSCGKSNNGKIVVQTYLWHVSNVHPDVDGSMVVLIDPNYSAAAENGVDRNGGH